MAEMISSFTFVVEMKSYLLCESTTQAVEQLEMSEDFFGGSEVALQNLRWEIQGFSSGFPNLSQADVVARFATGFDRRGSNAISLALNRSWDEQDQLITTLRLINAVAIYEAWTVSFCEEIGARPTLANELQVPEPLATARRVLSTHAEPLMSQTQAAYSRMKFHCEAGLHELLVCYRAFKEARNCLAHGGGRASAKAEQRWNAFDAVSQTWSGKGLMRYPPELQQIVQGQPVVLTQRGVIGCVAAVHRLMATFDGLAAGRTHGLDAAAARWVRSPTRPLRFRIHNAPGNRTMFGGRWTYMGFPALGGATQSMMDEFDRRGIIALP